MPVWMCELVLCVYAVLVGVFSTERVVKPVVFSYQSADLPHPATISHHYRGPVDSSATRQLPTTGAKDASPRIGLPNVGGVHPNDGWYQSTPTYNDGRPSKNYEAQSTFSPSVYDESRQDYDYVTVNPNHHYQSTTVAYYDEHRTDSNQYYPTPSRSSPVYDHQLSYDYPTSRSDLNYPSSTMAYYDDRPIDSGNYHRSYLPSSIVPPMYDENRPYYYSTSRPSKDFHSSTSSYYDDRPVGNSQYDANPSSVSPPEYVDNGQEYNMPVNDNSYHSTTGTYYDRLPSESYRTQPSPSPFPPIHEDHNHDYTTTSPHFMLTGNHDNDPIPPTYDPTSKKIQHPVYDMGSLSNNVSVLNGFIPTQDHQVPSTQVTIGFFNPDQPEPTQITEYTSPHPKSRRIHSTTTNFYEDKDAIISTTPITQFESVKEKLTPIQDYPPPNPGYITGPFKHMLSSRRNPIKLGNERISTVGSGLKAVHHGDKVLQQPKYFAYSSDLEDDRMGQDKLRGGVQHHRVQVSPLKVGQEYPDHPENDNHELDHLDEDHQNKKEEKYAKGGGQEHHAHHKASGGDKGDKGYKSSHKYSEGKKGHHDKEDHKGKYVDEKGKKGKKKEEGGHYGEHHQAEKGEKAAKYGESGEHKKGHSTKGEHNIHKKDEYMKKHEFYDEHHEGGDHEKFGGFIAAHAHKTGGKKKKGHHKSGSSHHLKGKKGHHEKGEKKDHHKGHKDEKGYDGHFAHHKKFGKKGGHKKAKIWGYTKGHPK